MILLLSVSSLSYAQTRISGTISDAGTKEPLIGVSVQVKNKIIGTITDIKGQFELNTSTPLPFELVISSIGYQTQEVQITSDNSDITISLEEQAIQGQEVVVAASRVEESVLRSASAVEKMNIRSIQQNPSSSFYEGLQNLKGIDLTTQGLLFKSVNMRGFGATGNVRTVQMIDGMDNQAPGLNFPVDNIIGMSELDLESVEIVPGAASALYGPNALNGLILMTSKSPFLYQGLSANVKSGVMTASNREVATTPFYDASIRYAKAFNNKFAFKINASYLAADDWQATNYQNQSVGGLADPSRGPGVDTDYDGLNVYGDEDRRNMIALATAAIASPSTPDALKQGLQSALANNLIPNQFITRTGYLERDMVDYNTKSLKANLALHYRLNENVEAIAQANFGYGTTVYTGQGRYSLRNFNLGQYKLELKGDNFNLRGYTTRENSGDSYLSGLAAVGLLNEAKPYAQWYGEYMGAYIQALGAGLNGDAAHQLSRTFADTGGKPEPGSGQFNSLYDKYKNLSIAQGGGRFLDKTNLVHFEGVYNFKNEIEFIDLLAGANFRQYQLRSEGTLFADQFDDRNGTIKINEFGAFLQAGKSLFSDHLKLTASGRYDKNQNFEGQFTPRVSAVTSFGDNSVRLSYQTGFRIPTTQNQYINLVTPQGVLIGGLPEFNDRYQLNTGIARQVIADFQANRLNTQYLTDTDRNTINAAVQAVLPAIQQQVIAAVQASVTAQVTESVTALVASGTLPAEQAPAVIAAQVASQMQSDAVRAAITENVTNSASDFGAAFAISLLPKYQYKPLTPERIQSWEIGYKGIIGKKLYVDAYYYQSIYKNFIGGTEIAIGTAPAVAGLPNVTGIATGNFVGYSRPANTDNDIKASGWAIGANYSLPDGFNIGANVANNELKEFIKSPEQQFAGFNSPKYRYNLSFGRTIGSGDKIGFNLVFRHQQAFTWESSFVRPTDLNIQVDDLFNNSVVPAINNLDAQVSFKLPAIKSILKIGGTNIGGKPYIQAFGSASIGSMYYASITFDELLNK
ncbi:carboxypeptidase-like regulatory domain-containing protein [Jiulongibacter sediminis]|uniref:TonB-dependent receptor n=1 Tax=Jiulongibacter sediminis TaxID=1605367 RepID=UPI0026EDB3C1|nr:carboxypeptidase-like regulatory domain-containing protein [Jiulongibacter sediminis]